jgi:type I restriction enzyme S subunit
MSSKTKTTGAMDDSIPPLVPKLRFPEFREASAWDASTLGELSEVVRGGSPRPIDGFITTSADGLNWLKIGDVDKEAKYVTNTAEKVRPEALSKTRVVNPGDLILSNSMSFGRPYILQIATCIHDGWIAITKISKKTDRDFLYYLISAPGSQSYFVDNAAGSGVLNLNADIIKALRACYPSPPEQQKIAECLSAVDELITAQARKLDALKTHKKGLMQQLFPREGETQPRLRFSEFQDSGEWKVKPLGKVAENLDNRRRPITSSDRTAGDVPYYGASGVVDYVEGFIFDEELLCISEDGANLVARTYPIAFPISGKTWVNNHAHVLRFANPCTQKFVEVYLNSIKLDDFITGMAQPKLNKAMLDKIPIPYPDVPEQQRIADGLTSLDDYIAAHTLKHEALKTHKKGLLQQLFPALTEVEA